MKRKATVESLPTKENKKLCIKTETGEVLSITRNFGDDDEATDQDMAPDTTSRKTPKSKQAPKGAPLRVAMPFQPPKANHNAERTSDGYERGSNNGANDQQVPSPSENSPSQSSSLHTVPCNKSNAGDHKDLLAAQTSAQPDAAGDRTTKDIIKSAALENQTTPVAQRSASFERTTCSASVQTEMGAMDTNSEHTRSLQEALDRMQRNVYRLLQLLAPDKDLGDISNIDQLVEGMIRVEELNSQSQSSFLQD